MRVKMTATFSAAGKQYRKGQVEDLPDKKARNYIALGLAEAYTERKQGGEGE